MLELKNETSTVPSTTNLGDHSTTDMYVDVLPHSVHIFGFGLYVTLLVLAFVVDTSILFVFCRVKEIRNVTNNLLCNMVAADLLFALQTPMEGLSILNDDWSVGNGLCKIHRFLLHTFYNVVIISLTIVSIERYYAICLPMRFKSLDIKSWRLILGSWVAACVLALPQVFVSSTVMSYDRMVCIEERPDNYLVPFLCYHVPMFIFLYFIPLVILTVTFVRVSKKLDEVVKRFSQRSRFDICGAIRMRRNIIRILLVVVVVFVVCLTPLTVVELLHVTPVMRQYDPFGILIVSVEMLAFSHALLNPLVCSFMSKEFRNAAKQAFNCSRSLTFDRCPLINRKEKDNKCKLDQMRQNETNATAGNGKAFWLNGQTDQPGLNDGFPSVTEMTDIPKEDE